MDQEIAQADSSYRKFKTIMFKADFADSALQGVSISSERLLGIDELVIVSSCHQYRTGNGCQRLHTVFVIEG